MAKKNRIDLTADNCVKILATNFGFLIKNDPTFGNVVLMPPHEAYLFSTFSNEAYE